ncbi:uncharacterized protein PITG_15598 [Phytophthora infestans T30-4]|uniref:DOT1 domain-containing protein n=1 Tax=Phytophthora infestans (strain T30-4) TaxID=403677 RepID=D0NT53_PHYIT|nr:uncharacterized protein PITG_15598 [Phytophthora infestans T30-4]EEY64809.1 conserved hypothetical protein [Phytophthora infestans T30-4]|eukprot:XP_002897736.1 conserved hypothetical protein [Phytophthora infestans T30-4]
MWTKFTDAEDKRLVVLALEYESQRKRAQWKEVARAMRGKYSAQALESRLRALKRAYGMDISRFPRFFFSTHRVKRNELSVMTDENAGEVLPAAVSKIIEMIGNIRHDDVFLDVGAGLGNVAAQFAVQTKARQCLGIKTRPELVSRGGKSSIRLYRLHHLSWTRQ